MPAVVESMMYTGATPWHGLGVHVEDAPTSEDAIKAAGLDWEVELTPLFVPGKERGFNLVPGKFATTRSTDGRVLGVVGNRYTPIQNSEAFSFLDSVVASGDVRYETAGSLFDGRKVWMLARLSEADFEVVSGDVVRQYLLLGNWHDGSGSLLAKLVDMRVVCNNTYAAALRENGRQARIRHSGDIEAKFQDAREILGFAQLRAEENRDKMKVLAGTQFTKARLIEFAEKLYPLPGADANIVLGGDEDTAEPTKAVKTRVERNRSNIMRLFETATGNDMPGVSGTAWAAFNAVTYLSTHEKKVRGLNGEGQESAIRARRLDSSWFGSSADLNQRAMGIALQMSS